MAVTTTALAIFMWWGVSTNMGNAMAADSGAGTPGTFVVEHVTYSDVGAGRRRVVTCTATGTWTADDGSRTVERATMSTSNGSYRVGERYPSTMFPGDPKVYLMSENQAQHLLYLGLVMTAFALGMIFLAWVYFRRMRGEVAVGAQ